MIKKELQSYKELSRTAQLLMQMDIIQNLLMGVVTGCFTYVVQESGIEAEHFKLLIMCASMLGLSNFYIKMIEYETLVKSYYVINITIMFALYFTTGVALVFVFEILFEIFYLLHVHIHNHQMDKIKEEINIRDFNATMDGLSTITLLIGMLVGYILIHYVSAVEVVVYGNIAVRVWDIYIVRKMEVV